MKPSSRFMNERIQTHRLCDRAEKAGIMEAWNAQREPDVL